MRRRFFVDEVHAGHAKVDGDDAQHLTRVLRVEVGQRYEISDNRQAYLAEIESTRKSEVIFRVVERLESEPARVHVTLYAALVKFDHFEWMVEKATELGVARIVPVIATRTERGLDKAAGKRVERWRKIAIEASQQSRRTFLPEVSDAVPFAEAVTNGAGYRYLLDEAGGPELLTALPERRTVEDRVALMVGPEGGWTAIERSALSSAGWEQVSLGPLILRAETAAMTALAVVSAGWRGTLTT
jgi:16S rRNA (uracil1498-N3)-methyltransferase